MENNELINVKGKELVAAGHQFAANIGADTSLIDMAKMVSQLATLLDVALVRGDAHMQAEMVWEKSMMEAIGDDGVGCVVKAINALKAERDALQQKLDAVLAENASMRSAIDHTIGWQESVDAENVESVRALVDLKTPTTDAILNAVRADADVSDEMALAFHRALGDGSLGDEEIEEIKTGLRAALLNYAQPVAVMQPPKMPQRYTTRIGTYLVSGAEVTRVVMIPDEHGQWLSVYDVEHEFNRVQGIPS